MEGKGWKWEVRKAVRGDETDVKRDLRGVLSFCIMSKERGDAAVAMEDGLETQHGLSKSSSINPLQDLSV